MIVFFSDLGQIDGDGIARWNALWQLMENHRLTGDKYSIVQPLAAIPLFVAGDVYVKIGRLWSSPGAADRDPAIRQLKIMSVVRRFNKFVILLIAIWFYSLLKNRLSWSFQAASSSTIFLLFGSMLIPHAKDFYSECLWTGLSIASLFLLSEMRDKRFSQIPRKRRLAFLLITALLMPLNPSLMIVFAGLSLFIGLGDWIRIRTQRRTSLSSFLAPQPALIMSAAVLGGSICIAENYLRRGGLFDFGYGDQGFTGSFITGALGNLFSPARGIVYFIPSFFLGFYLVFRGRSLKIDADLSAFLKYSLIYSALLFILYSKWTIWWNGWYWGPRFFLPLSVFGCLYFLILIKETWSRSSKLARVVLLIPGVLSVLVYKVGAAVNQEHLLAWLRRTPEAEPACYWEWRFSPFSSYFNLADLKSMLMHRSTAVEIIGLIILALIYWIYARPHGSGAKFRGVVSTAKFRLNIG
ncbi:MAG TPA: hypothetical protein VF398_06855 [bacterium]